MHIVVIELMIDPICSLAFGSEKEEKNLMTRPPKDPKQTFFGGMKILKSVAIGVLLFVFTVVVYFGTLKLNLTENQTRTVTFCTLIFCDIFLVLSTLSKSRNLFQILQEKNRALLMILSVTLILLIFMIENKSLQEIFQFQRIPINYLIYAFLLSLVFGLFLEGIKYFERKNN